MSESPTTRVLIEAAAVSDRGLNERRPLNEDSYLAQPEHGIFAVADGVGGAEAGEVASQTAIEVLEEAFRNHHEGDDIEDLLEIAIQRANNSIYRMSREHPKLAMMATTVVALHLDGRRATVGHVGDSRLYRVSPDGRIHRETEDHSVVEEEVRAGRMTPEQAQNHPSRNVISRAIGAEPDVEVDLKTFEVEEGTVFLVCTDGITRHVPDGEMARVVASAPDLQTACDTLKRLCYERGAEDNLTAVLVRVGQRAGGAPSDEEAEGEATLDPVKMRREVSSQTVAEAFAGFERSQDRTQELTQERPALQPAAQSNGQTGGRGGAGAQTPPPHSTAAHAEPGAASDARPAARSGGGFGRFLVFLLLVAIFSAAAFYGGTLYERRRAEAESAASVAPPPGPAAPSDGALALGSFELDRNRVDSAPVSEVERMGRELQTDPGNAEDPKFLYLYGRALLLAGRAPEALPQLERAVAKIQETPSSANARLLVDARLATAAVHLRSNDVERARASVDALGEMFAGAGAPQSAPSGESPAASPAGPPASSQPQPPQ